MPTTMKFTNLNNLLSTEESNIKLFVAINISLNKLNAWLDPNNKAASKADSLVKMVEYFRCTVNYLLDMSSRSGV